MPAIETLNPTVRRAMEKGADIIQRPNGNFVYRRYTIHDIPCFTSGEYPTDENAAQAFLGWLTDAHIRAPFPRHV